MPKALVCLLAILPLVAHAGLFGNNTTDDIFTVKKVDAKDATAEGTPKDLKVGDMLYFARSPYQFRVLEVKGNMVRIALPDKQDLAVGNTLMRKDNDQIKKGIDTEKKLKQALDE
jgi:hypothetical protein